MRGALLVIVIAGASAASAAAQTSSPPVEPLARPYHLSVGFLGMFATARGGPIGVGCELAGQRVFGLQPFPVDTGNWSAVRVEVYAQGYEQQSAVTEAGGAGATLDKFAAGVGGGYEFMHHRVNGNGSGIGFSASWRVGVQYIRELTYRTTVGTDVTTGPLLQLVLPTRSQLVSAIWGALGIVIVTGKTSLDPATSWELGLGVAF